MYVIEQPERGRLLVEGIQSKALRGRSGVFVYLPPGYDDTPDRRYPVLYLLHGAYGWEWDWVAKGRAHFVAEQLIKAKEIEPIIMVMPSDGLRGIGTLYVNWADNSMRCEDWIAKELVGWTDSTLRTIASREGRCITGLSMGGFGAMNVGLRNRKKFRSIASHSGFFRLTWARRRWAGMVFGTGSDGRARRQANSPYHYVGDIRGRDLPKLYMDCGVDDFLYQDNVAMHARLEELRIQHIYNEFPGAHDWEYWSEHIADSLRFHFGKSR